MPRKRCVIARRSRTSAMSSMARSISVMLYFVPQSLGRRQRGHSSSCMDRQAGFTLIETLLGAALAATMLWALVAMVDRLFASAGAANLRVNASANAARLIERLSSEAASSLAVYVPATDALGQSNSDGHEVDFFTQDG